MARIAGAWAVAGLLVSLVGCATPPTYYDYGSPVVTGGVPYNAGQPVYMQPGTQVPMQVQPGMAPNMVPANGYVGQPTPANPARMQPVPATGGGAN